MADSYDWQMARRVARLATHAPGRGLPRWELIAGLGDAAGFDTWVKLAYSRRWVDCVRDYVVAPTLGPGPGEVPWETRGTPQSPHGSNGGPWQESPKASRPRQGPSSSGGEQLFP